MSESSEDLPSVPVFYLPSGEQLVLHSGTPSAGDWPISFSEDNNLQMLLLEDGQIALTNGLQLFVNPLTLTDMKGEGEVGFDPNIAAEGASPLSLSHLMASSQHFVQLADQDEGMSGDEASSICEEETGDALSSFVDVITTFKCRMCMHSAVSRDELISHIRSQHMEPKPSSPSDSGASSPCQGDPDDPSVAEKLVFLCAQCAEAFDSLEACRLHMVEDHRLVTEEQDRKATQAAVSPPSPSPLPSPVPPSPPPAPSPPEEVPKVREKRNTRLPKSLGSEYHLGKHSKMEVDSRISCPSIGCVAKFTSEKELDLHDLCHNSDDRDFRCCECGKHFDNWKPCALHLWRSHQIDAGMLPCAVCGYKTSTSMKLSNHMRIHSEAREFRCCVCNKTFKQLSQLRNHSVVHLDRTGEAPGAVQRWYTAKQCHVCHKTYADSKCLKKHVAAVHGRIKPYMCPVCGHSSARKAMLQLHLRQHTGEKPYGCDTCNFRTGDHNSLRRHKMRHSGVKQYQCPHCSYAAIQSNSYKNHLRCKHPDKEGGVFECGQCPYRCISEEAYLSHLGDHKRKARAQQSLLQRIEEDVFPGNVAAARFIFRCLNTMNEGQSVQANIASQQTSPDGTEQTITIQIPADSSGVAETDDDGCIRVEDLVAQRPVDEPDLGGITIPADPTPPPEEPPSQEATSPPPPSTHVETEQEKSPSLGDILDLKVVQ